MGGRGQMVKTATGGLDIPLNGMKMPVSLAVEKTALPVVIEEEVQPKKVEYEDPKKESGLSDFGEKIGGARKDLWKERGMISADIDLLTALEADKYVKRDIIWKVNHDDLLSQGYTKAQVYAIEQIRKSIPPKPYIHRTVSTQEELINAQKQYVETINKVKEMILQAKTPQDYKAINDEIFIKSGLLIPQQYGFKGSESFYKNPALQDTLYYQLRQLSNTTETDLAKYAEQSQIGVSKEDKIPKGYRVGVPKQTFHGTFEKYNGKHLVLKGSSIIGAFDSHREAVDFAQESSKQNRSEGKKRFVPKQLEHIKRIGDDYRKGKDVDGNAYTNEFKFRAGEFGNWMTENDRRESMNMGYDAMKDLAKTLGVSEKSISVDGKLAIAFGSRGVAGAAAHYEPERKVINLTKMNGAGSLAHEWFHAIDNIVGEKLGLGPGMMLTDGNGQRAGLPIVDKLVKTMKYKDDGSRTDFYNNSIKMDHVTAKTDGRYWQSNSEMAARAFASYITDKTNGNNDYLSGHSELAIGIDYEKNAIIKAIPEGTERTKINSIFDELIGDLKHRNLL